MCFPCFPRRNRSKNWVGYQTDSDLVAKPVFIGSDAVARPKTGAVEPPQPTLSRQAPYSSLFACSFCCLSRQIFCISRVLGIVGVVLVSRWHTFGCQQVVWATCIYTYIKYTVSLATAAHTEAPFFFPSSEVASDKERKLIPRLELINSLDSVF